MDVEDVDALASRWMSFVDGTTQQLGMLLAEAEPLFEQALREHPLEPAHLEEAARKLTASLAGLESAVDAAWTTLETDIDRLVSATGDTRLYARREALEGARWELHGLLEVQGEEFLVRKAGEAGRRALALAREELQRVREQGVPCGGCGAPLFPQVLHETASVTCPKCRLMSEVSPGPVVQAYLAGGSADAIGKEAAWKEGLALREAESHFEALEGPTEADAKVYEAAAAAYWRAYAQARGEATPGWNPARLEADVERQLAGVRERARRALKRTPSFLWEVANKAGQRGAVRRGGSNGPH
jgi:hypothetical protein